ncbi:N-acetylmuramoyl-L-alanine amidase [Hyphomicrobium sp.]|uniref:N-acetylmuramoyl-L-alanine amidase n=1 Tax=Hyphomicrobium sp. TaxID=82 RepID=UPI003F6EF572
MTGAGGLRAALALTALLALAFATPQDAYADPAAAATQAALSGDKTRTTLRIEMTAGVTAEIFTLANPYRVIVDLPDVSFRLPDGTGQTGTGLVQTFRYGLFADKKARIVLDTTGPVRIERAAMTAAPADKGIIFTFDMVTTAPESFGLGTGADRAAEAPAPAAEQPGGAKPRHPGKPIIMIDPGHGGIDGGAVSASNTLEKNVVLAVGKELARQLSTSGRYDVRLTRSTDVFISLDQRLGLSSSNDVDLFLSLHADSLADVNGASGIRGATVYTLSERASDDHARRMAEKENASDAVAGLSVGKSQGDDEVKSILFDLMKRETANFSTDFSNVLIRQLKRTVLLSRVPQRAAAFKVLKQTHSPSVLVELGYLSHPEDEKLLNSPAWHKQTATAIAAAIETYFSKRTAGPSVP